MKGGFSSLSLLLYTIFLFLLFISARPNPSSHGPLISHLPKRLQSIAKVLLVIIPFLLASNAVSNFWGISFLDGHAGFKTSYFYGTHTFVASLTLALLSLFSALSFLLLAYQSLLVLTHDSPTTSSQERVHLMCGLPYLALGTKLAFIDAIAGFAPMAFSGILFRRLLRFGGRIALVWGGINGLDYEEDFRGQGGLAQVLKGKGNGTMRISSPRALSPQEEMTQRGMIRPPSSAARYRGMMAGHPYAYGSASPALPPRALAEAGSAPLRRERAGERVTVHYQRGYAPHLELRLSGLGVPDTATLVRDIKGRGLLEDVWDRSDGIGRKKSIREMRLQRKQKERELDQISEVSGDLRVYSIHSEDWHILRFSSPPKSSQIPTPPPAVLQRAVTSTTTTSSFLNRKPVPALLSPLPRHSGVRLSDASGWRSPMTAASQGTFGSVSSYQTRDSGDWLKTASKGTYAPATYRATGTSLPVPSPLAVGGGEGNPFSPGPGATDDVDNYHENSHYVHSGSTEFAKEMQSAEGIVKIKAIRNAPVRVTPPPTQAGFWRSSVEIKRGITPSKLSSSEGSVEDEGSGEDGMHQDDLGVDSPTLGHAF
ncbi:hypothetical protein HWV62_41471 [Athelia sp. TMB]|nr:hypothetical protein HWV62_41471 [Athelia sp. TMB]